VLWRPITLPSTPPSVAPTGIVPHEMNRIVAFIRPRTAGGVIACRRLMALTFQKTPSNDRATIVAVNAGKRSESDARAMGSHATLLPIDAKMMIGPTPTSLVSRLVSRAPAITPTEPIENASPIRAGANWCSVTSHKMRIESATLPKRFPMATVRASARSTRLPIT
jgi:hypothetical protein